MLPDEKTGCHRTGFTRKCRELVTSGECCRWRRLEFRHPQTGVKEDRYDCIDNLTDILLLIIAQQERQAGATMDKVATEVKNASDAAAERDAHLINGLRATFPVLQVAAHLNQLQIEKREGGGDDDAERQQRQ